MPTAKFLIRAAGAVLVFVAGSASTRPFTARDLAMLDRVSAPRLSPDGRFLAHIVRSTDWDSNGGVHALHVTDLRAAGAKPFVIVAKEKSPPVARWSADGRSLYFLSGKSGTQQVWRAAPDGSARSQLTALPVDATGFRLLQGGNAIIVSADVHPDCETLACTKSRVEDQAKLKSSGVRIRKGANRFWDAYEDERMVGLFRVSFDQPGAPAEAAAVLKGFGTDVPADDAMVVGRDGRTLYFVSRDPAIEQGGEAYSWLYAVPADGSAAPRRIAGGGRTSITRPALSPDGSRLAYIQSSAPAWTYGRSTVMLMDLKSGRTREVAPTLDLVFSRVGWSADGRRLVAVAEDRGQMPLMEIDPATGAVRTLSLHGQVSDFDTAPGTTAFVRETLNSPQQIFVRQGSAAERQITTAGAEILAQAKLGAAEQFTFAGWNGETVHGYVVQPHGYVPGRKYPVAFLIHGGPHGSFGNAWSYRWNPQVWAGMGYAVVTVDFHGSSGYGEAFGRSILNHWGDRPLEDLKKGWSHALARFAYLDGNRACALGGSYGGYMVNWIASQWKDPWKCLVNHAGLFDLRFAGWSMDITNFIDAQHGGSPTAADIERFNPALHVGSWTVPMLVIHGARDYRVTVDQGIAAHNAARRSGVPTELLLFPDENHWVLKPQNSVQWYAAVEDWLDRWTATPEPAR